MAEQRYCPKCRRTMADTNFYTHKDKTKAELCKSCQTMHINNFDPDTFLWLLEEYDVPWIEAEWNTLRDRAYQKDPYKMNGMSVFGKYLSKMKLKQWNKYGWADTERLKQEEEEKRKAAMGSNNIVEDDKNYEAKMARMKEAYENGEITESQYQTYAAITAPEAGSANPYENNSFTSPVSPYPVNGDFEQVELIDVGADLTEEDKIYLAMKWGRLYRADEWVALEKLYEDFMQSFDIQDAARLDQLKKICKTSLKMDQALDAGDVDTYQKLSKVYDSMMKAGKFTEAQKKETNSNFVDSHGEIVAYCEKCGGQIPKFEIEEDFDIIDTIIKDLKEYNKSLIYEDKALAQEIEDYLKNKQIAEQMKRDREEAKEKGLDYVELQDEDYQKFREMIEDQHAEDDYIGEEADE